ncbi:hypothetical protein PBS_54340 [Paraburkholderia sp. 2C]
MRPRRRTDGADRFINEFHYLDIRGPVSVTDNRAIDDMSLQVAYRRNRLQADAGVWIGRLEPVKPGDKPV